MSNALSSGDLQHIAQERYCVAGTVWHVAANGNDSSGDGLSFSTAFATPYKASNSSTGGIDDLILFGPGTFALGATAWSPPCSVKGAGIDRTIFTTTANGTSIEVSGQGCCIAPASNTLHEDYTLTGIGTPGIQFPLGGITLFSNHASTGGYLVGGDSYGYQVSAYNAIGETIPSPYAIYNVPSGTSTNTIKLHWATVSGATGYKIYRTAANGPYTYNTSGNFPVSTAQLIATVSGQGSSTFTDTIQTPNGANTGGFAQFLFGSAGAAATAISGLTVRRVKMVGDSDCVYATSYPLQADFFDCEFNSFWDTVNLNSGPSVQFFNCIFHVTGPNNEGEPGEAHGLLIGNGYCLLDGCKIVVNSPLYLSTDQVYGIDANGLLIVKDTIIQTSATGGINSDITCGGTGYVGATSYNPLLSGGSAPIQLTDPNLLDSPDPIEPGSGITIRQFYQLLGALMFGPTTGAQSNFNAMGGVLATRVQATFSGTDRSTTTLTPSTAV